MGAGDFFLEPDHRLTWRDDAETAPYVYGGLHMSHPRLYVDAPTGAFSLVELWRQAQKAGRLFGLVHEGSWHDVGTPAGRDGAEALLEEAQS